MAATTSASGRSIEASVSAARAASVMRSRSVSSRFPKRVIPAPAIQTSMRYPFQTGDGSVSMFSAPEGNADALETGQVYGRRLARRTAGSPGRRTRRGRLGPTWRRGRGWNTDLKLAHEPQQIRSLKSQRPRRSRAIAADLGQRRLDQATLEVADGTVKADGGAGRGRSDNRRSCHDRLRETVSRNLGRTRARQRSHEHF